MAFPRSALATLPNAVCDGVLGLTGDPLPTQTVMFMTFQSAILKRIEQIDARDVVWVQAPGSSPCSDAIAVAEGDALRPDIMGGIRIYDVTDLSQAPTLLAEQDTAGVDWALHYVPAEQVDPPIATTGPYANTWNGPLLLSTEGRGSPSGSASFTCSTCQPCGRETTRRCRD